MINKESKQVKKKEGVVVTQGKLYEIENNEEKIIKLNNPKNNWSKYWRRNSLKIMVKILINLSQLNEH